MRWSPLPCSAAPCWETTLMMLSQSLGSRLREKTPHSRMFKKIVQREAGGRNVSGSGVQFACRSALGDHERFPTPVTNAPLLMEFPTSKREFPLQLQFPTPQTNAPHRNDNCPHQKENPHSNNKFPTPEREFPIPKTNSPHRRHDSRFSTPQRNIPTPIL